MTPKRHQGGSVERLAEAGAVEARKLEHDRPPAPN